jgi:hypothetical protein
MKPSKDFWLPHMVLVACGTYFSTQFFLERSLFFHIVSSIAVGTISILAFMPNFRDKDKE